MLERELLLKLAAEYGTPLFVYDGDMVVERYNDLFRFIPWERLRIHYAFKANYNPALLTLLRDAGAGLDTVSPGEVHLALKLGFSPEKIIYTANNMTDAEVEEVLATGVVMNIGSLSRLRKLAKSHPGLDLCLRFNPDVRDGDSEKTMTGGDLTKFGILLESVDEVLEIVREGKFRIVGLHEHTGSGLPHAEVRCRCARADRQRTSACGIGLSEHGKSDADRHEGELPRSSIPRFRRRLQGALPPG